MDDFTSARIWLPGEALWEEVQFGEVLFLHAVPWLALLLLVLRSGWRCLSGAVGGAVGVSGRSCSKPPSNGALEAAFARSRRPSAREEQNLAAELRWPPHRVRRWLHRARSWRKPSVLSKFKESSWRLVLYSLSTAYGFLVLIDEPFFQDLSRCYSDYPLQAPSNPAMSYWCLQTALYISELVACLTGDTLIKKDFAVLILHHCMTLALLVICYTINMVPIGLVIALLHDVADILLEAAKLLVYIKGPAAANIVFAAFSLVFVSTRLVVLPNWILPSLMYDLPQYAGSHSLVTRAAIIFLMALLGLHLYWLTLIAKVGLQLLRGSASADSRSDSEVSDSDSHLTPPPHTINHNIN